MSKKLCEEQSISDIGQALRYANNGSSTYYLSQMASAVRNLKKTIESLSINQNGSYHPSAYNLDAFSDVVVAVPNTYTSTDEGKVVNNGELQSQSSLAISDNGTFDTTMHNQVVVSVESGHSGVLISRVFNQNGSYDAYLDDNADGYSQVIISVPTEQTVIDGAALIEGNVSEIIDLSASIVRSYFYVSQSLIQNVSMASVKKINQSAFYACSELRALVFPECEDIEPNAFYNCKKLSDISFPKCKHIGYNGFAFCGSLTTVNFPECLTLGGKAFLSDTALSSVYLPRLVSISGSGAFKECSSLSGISLPNCQNLGSSMTFSSCRNLATAFLPEVALVPIGAFYSCCSLSSVDIRNCTMIASSAFLNCHSLTELSLPNCLSIGYYAFANCLSLSRVIAPKCKSIGPEAFIYCDHLSEVYLLGSSIVSLARSECFSNTPIMKSSYLGYFGSIYVPESLVDAYKSASVWSYFSDRITAYTGE